MTYPSWEPEYRRQYGREYARRWRAANPDRQLSIELKNRYGITLEDYRLLEEQQKGLCAICKQPCKRMGRLSVDHDHETGKIRGLLCHDCNAGLGRFRDQPSLLMAAAEYLSE